MCSLTWKSMLFLPTDLKSYQMTVTEYRQNEAVKHSLTKCLVTNNETKHIIHCFLGTLQSWSTFPLGDIPLIWNKHVPYSITIPNALFSLGLSSKFQEKPVKYSWLHLLRSSKFVCFFFPLQKREWLLILVIYKSKYHNAHSEKCF